MDLQFEHLVCQINNESLMKNGSLPAREEQGLINIFDSGISHFQIYNQLFYETPKAL
jgi:hypothetical protein